jgi:hypothetical protein
MRLVLTEGVCLPQAARACKMSEGSNICNRFGHCQYSYERFQTLLWVLETNGEARSMTIKESSPFMGFPMAS